MSLTSTLVGQIRCIPPPESAQYICRFDIRIVCKIRLYSIIIIIIIIIMTFISSAALSKIRRAAGTLSFSADEEMSRAKVAAVDSIGLAIM